MKKMSISLLLIVSLLGQTMSFAQQSPRRSDPDTKLQEQPSDDEKAELKDCEDSINLGDLNTSPTELTDIQDSSSLLIGNEDATPDELKEIYKKHNCNPDTVDEIKPEKGFFGVQDFHESKSDISKSKKDFQERLKACHLHLSLTDGEDCKATRDLHKAMETGKFTTKEFNSINANEKNQKSDIAGVIDIVYKVGSLAIATYAAYVLHQDHQEKENHNDSSKTSPCTTTAPTTETPKQEPSAPIINPPQQPQTKESPAPETKPSTPEPQQTHEIHTVDIQKAEPLPAEVFHEINKPIVHATMEYEQKAWLDFSSKVKKENEECDQKKSARKNGLSLGIIKNASTVHFSNSIDNSKFGGCDSRGLKFDLINLTSKKQQCHEVFGCGEISKEQRRQNKARKAHDEFMQNCAMNMGGKDKEEKDRCKKSKELFEQSSGIKIDGGMDSFLKELDKLNPPPAPDPFVVKPDQSVIHGNYLPTIGGH